MPPRNALIALRAVPKDTAILSFLYPIASRRLLSSTTSRRADDQPKEDRYAGQFHEILGKLPLKRTNALPDLSTEMFDPVPRLAKKGSNPEEWANRLQRSRNAFGELNNATNGIENILEKYTQQTQKLEEYREQEYIDPEIFRHAAPLREGSYASPKDLTFEEYEKYLRNRRNHLRQDIFDQLMENPMEHYKNFNLLKDFMTSAGRIKHRSVTGLSNTNQRKLSKAIRRAVGIGLLPSVYRHPEVLKVEQKSALAVNPTERYRMI